MERFFDVNIEKYVPGNCHHVFRPASLNHPKDESVMFVTEGFVEQASALTRCRNCLVFWPLSKPVPSEIGERHGLYLCENPRREFSRFFADNQITNLPEPEKGNWIEGAWIAEDAVIGSDSRIFPGAYVGGGVIMGSHCYIGSGVRLIGRIRIGNHVVIRENSVLGADGLSTDRDEQGCALTMPQFGGIVVEDGVQIGALTVIARGAIDDTIIRRGAKIDNSSFISHNVCVGENTFIVGETIMFGSSSTDENVFISGNVAVRNGVHIGRSAVLGMGSVVVRDVDSFETVKGNPAR